MICRIKHAICYALLGSLWLSCGPYSFSSSGAAHLQTVAIPIFQDQTSEFGVKENLTNKVIEQFTRDNTLRVTDRRNADSLIEGTIVSVEEEAGAFAADETVQDIKVFITVKVKYRDLVKRKVVWEETIRQWGTFDPNEGPQSRDSGIEEAADKLANEILNKSVSGW